MPDIFIVDDSISVRKALEITLRNHSMDSRSAVSAEQAVEMLEGDSGTCDLLMVDVIMPGMSGLDFCMKVKSTPELCHLPVILMSGNVDDEIRAQAQEAGADGVLKKPFKSEELIPMVEHVLAMYKAQAEGEAEPLIDIDVDDEDAAEEEMTVIPTEPTINQADLDALSALLQTYEDHPLVRDVVILDRDGNPIKQTGNVLPENIQMFARFFTNTAGVLGKQMIGEDIESVSIKFGRHEMVIHSLPAHFVVVLMNYEYDDNSRTMN